MTNANAVQPAPARLTDWPLHRPLALAGLLSLALIAPSLAAHAVDARLFNGVGVWVKPIKFQLSVGVYLLTLAVFAGALTPAARQGRAMRTVAWTAIGAGAFEVVYITVQAARGSASHFNVAEPVPAFLYSLMGVGAVLLTGVSGVLAWLLVRRARPGLPGAALDGVRAGLALTAVLGILTGAAISANGSHWVGGLPSDAGGLPLLGWVRDGGDLRPAHFLGIHALHIMPVVGLAVGGFGLKGVPARLAVLAAALAYIALTAWLWAEAMAGRPML